MTSSTMAYHRGGHAGAVAVSYSTNAMPTPLSPSRRYSSGNTGTTTSGVGSSSSSKLSSYRSSSSFDRPSYLNSGSSSSSGYSSTHRSSYSSEYRRYCSPARSLSVSSSSYSDTGTGSSSCSGISPSNNTTSLGSSRYSTSSSSRDRSESRETLGSLATSAADLYAKYSPANYVPNIIASNERNASNNSASSSKGLLSSTINGYGNNYSSSSTINNITSGNNSISSNSSAIVGGNSANAKISSLRDSSASELLSSGNIVQGRPPRAARRSPVNTVINNHAQQQQPENAANAEEGSPTIRAPRNRLQTPRDERCGLNGLRNIGNTCFMNSVIQCLSNTRPLLEYLVNEQYLADINTSTSGMKGALIKAFSQVIQELWEVGGDHVVNTASLKSQIQRFAPRFMGYSQQDAQEFLRYLLEGLHEDVNRVTVKPQPIHTDIPEHYTDSQKAAESWKRYLRNEDSTIVDVFVGQLRSSLHCTSCGHVSVTLDPFWDLSLPIPTRSGTVKLNQCLEHFTKEEVLDGDEKPTCSKCQMRRKCTKSFSIQKFPKILVIHLKRFSPMERFRGKLNTLVDFPLTGLDLGAFSAPRVAGCTYNLYGVANHSGTTYSGHYTAYCKHPYSGEWHEYNDSRVSSIAARSVVSSEGYVLFYEQQPHSSNL